MALLPFVVLVGVALLCVALTRRSQLSARELERLDQLSQFLAARHAPLVLGALSALLVWWWMGWYPDPAPVIQDEAAYLLQAELFARGRWTGLAVPLPEFFAQMHVFTTPVLASKYPPGTSLALTPFVALGFTVLGPMLFAAVTGALVFALARRVTDGPVALLTWLLWSSTSAVLRYQGSFLSQTVTTPLWLATLYFLLEYRTHRRAGALVAVGACLGFMAITRPVTALALAVPVGVVVLRDAWRLRAWRPVALAALAGTAFVSIIPLHNQKTTGDWRLSPLVSYSRTYTPFDLPGFGYDRTRHRVAPLPPDLHATREYLAEARRRHTLAALPATLGARARFASADVFRDWRAPLALFALAGVLVMPVVGLFALGTSLGLFVAHAFHAHWPDWPVYYMEGYPAIVFASAVGCWAFAEWLVQRHQLRHRIRTMGAIGDPRVRAAVVALCVFLALPASIALRGYRADWQHNISYQRRLVTALSIIRDVSPRSIVFINYGRDHMPDLSLVWNVPDLGAAQSWLAYDRGLDNVRLMRLAPERRAFVFRADEGSITPLPPLPQLEKMLAAGQPERQ